MTRKSSAAIAPLLSRIAAAVLGGYLLANGSALALAYLMPGAFATALEGGIMVGFVVYLLAVMWVFAVDSTRRAWAGILLPLALCLVVVGIGKWRAAA
ncbi:MAG TPA: DUF3649 domain-containing protein [Hyphomicrobiales bacterium]|nr:DUF3649 domain-containing protein [Hyphomicrobiales bacterium]